MYWCFTIYWLSGNRVGICHCIGYCSSDYECRTLFRTNHCDYTGNHHCARYVTMDVSEIGNRVGNRSVLGGEFHLAKCYGENDESPPTDDYVSIISCW